MVNQTLQASVVPLAQNFLDTLMPKLLNGYPTFDPSVSAAIMTTPYENVATTTDLLETLKERNRVASSLDSSSFGSVCGIPETPTILTMGLSHLRDALSAMPEEMKNDYMTASEIVPNLVQSESDPTWYLRRESFNPWATARRLAWHWEYRNFLYQAKWLHAGEGKLETEDMEILQSGWLTIVPRPPQTTLIFLNNSKLDGDPVDQKLKAAFHICVQLGAHSSAQKDGVFMIHNNVNQKWHSLESLGVLIEMIHRATPVKIAKCAILRSDSEERGSTADIVNTKLHQTYVRLLGSDVPNFLNIRDISTGAKRLEEEFEITGAHVPNDLGGQWSYEHLMEWQTSIGSTDSDPPASMAFLTNNSGSSYGDDKERAEDLSKARNALYARRAYQKRKAKEAETQQEVHRLQQVQAVLRRDNQRLNNFMNQALAAVALFKSGEESKKPKAI